MAVAARTHPKVYTIEAGTAFARVLAQGTIKRVGRDPLALADVTIFVPTRRAVRTLHEAFSAELEGASLGPRIRALGDLDEAEDAFDPSTDDLALQPAIGPLKRRLVLATMVERWHRARGGALPFAQAVSHAGELARFLDEAAEQNADLTKLKHLAPTDLARHWEEVVDFLGIIGTQWPLFLEESGWMEPAARRDALIRQQALRFATHPPQGLVIAAGSTGSIPATRELLKTIACLPQGALVLPALDTILDAASWEALDAGHAQYGLKQLLAHVAIARDEVLPWEDTKRQPSSRSRFIAEALRPPPTTHAWRDMVEKEKDAFADALIGLSLIEAANPQEEALAIAMALREALETPQRTAALVTPDRGIARRVAAELSRWNIKIDDSAGTPLSRTPPGVFLALLARAAAEDFAPVALLALLKHPLAAGGRERATFRRNVRAMERAALRGLRPENGLTGIELRLRGAKRPDEQLIRWFTDLQDMLEPLQRITQARDVPLRDIVSLHARIGEALAATANAPGTDHLWRGEAGEAAATLVKELIAEGEDIILGSGDHYADLFRDLGEARVVRPRGGLHPRLALLGPLEARLQHFDLVVLGGLNEGVWPAETATDPWLSRPMRGALGLEPPERKTGLAAHDFATLAAGPTVLLTRSLKQHGAPTHPSRWLLRLKQLARGLEIAGAWTALSPPLDWARRIDDAPRETRAARPEPRPPVAVRPRALSVTQIETWLRDPYAIYAKHILRLKPLDPIDVEPGPRERGIAIHGALERFLNVYPNTLPEDALAVLLRLGDEAFRNAGASHAATALWRPRFSRAAQWFLAYETERRKALARAMTEIEIDGRLEIPAPGGMFTLRGRADRIEIFDDGAASLLDYKTGRVPSQKQIEILLAPQLPLEAAMLMRGAFEGVRARHIREFVHVQLTGAVPPGRELIFDKDATEKAEEALTRLMQRIARYDDEAQPYRSRETMERLSDISDYDHLARVREWSLIGEGGE